MNTTFPTNLVSVKFLARTFHQLPEQLIAKLKAIGVEPVTYLDGVPFYASDVVDQLNETGAQRLVRMSRHETT